MRSVVLLRSISSYNEDICNTYYIVLVISVVQDYYVCNDNVMALKKTMEIELEQGLPIRICKAW